MSDEIIFYHSPMSRGRIVHWMLEEVGAPYRNELINLEKGHHKSNAYLVINSMGKLPAIVHRGVVITEVAAICTYLADAFPEKHLAPPIGDPARGTYLRWMFFSASCVDAAMVDRMLARPPPTTRAGALGFGTLENVMATLEKALHPGPYLLGEHFSAADITIGSALSWGVMMKTIELSPVMQAYLARARTRPAFQRFNAQGAEMVEKMKAA